MLVIYIKKFKQHVSLYGKSELSLFSSHCIDVIVVNCLVNSLLSLFLHLCESIKYRGFVF